MDGGVEKGGLIHLHYRQEGHDGPGFAHLILLDCVV